MKFRLSQVGVGPGGLNCICCAPARGKCRKALMRTARRVDKVLAYKYEQVASELASTILIK
jgi:hypothetical protein